MRPVGPGITIFNFLLVFCCLKIEQNKKGKITSGEKRKGKKGRKIHRRDGLPRKELALNIVPTTCGDSPRVSLWGLPKRKKELI